MRIIKDMNDEISRLFYTGRFRAVEYIRMNYSETTREINLD